MLKGFKDEVGLLEDIGEDTVTDKKSHKHLHVVGEGTVQRDNDPMIDSLELLMSLSYELTSLLKAVMTLLKHDH